MATPKSRNNVRARVITAKKAGVPVEKAADQSAQIPTEQNAAGEVISPKYPITELMNLIEMSTILRQCCDAYKQNICGFGVALRYKDDETAVDETTEMKAEWNNVDSLIRHFNFDKPFKDVFGQAIWDREACGNGYIEILRNGAGTVDGAENVDPRYMKTTPLGDLVPVNYLRDGKTYTRFKRFRKYVQEVNGKRVWYKQFGDPRKMDKTTGKYGESVTPENEATEILHLKVGDGAYGIPRWIGNLIHIYGARKAEELNYNYFHQGRHTPMAIILTNGTLSEDSVDALADYAKAVEGVENAHKFLVLEVETIENDDAAALGLDDGKKKVAVELKSLADMLQQDALFLEYDDKSRDKVLSAFRLPPVYVGLSTDYNRATVVTAKQVAEEQVFVPERESLEFTINEQLFDEYNFKHVEAYFNSPDLTDPTDFTNMLTAFVQADAVAPNDLRDVVGKLLGKSLQTFADPNADLPAGLRQQSAPDPFGGIPIQKSAGRDGIVEILKDLRDILEEQRTAG